MVKREESEAELRGIAEGGKRAGDKGVPRQMRGGGEGGWGAVGRRGPGASTVALQDRDCH